jgi:branched-chain amino acid transport system permease protein
MAGIKQELRITLAALIVLFAAHFFASEYTLRLLNLALISAITVLGLNFVFGWAGLISLAQAAFVGFGAYATALLTTRLKLDPWSASALAIAATAVTAFLVGSPILRLRGHYLALATLGLNVSFEIVTSNWLGLTSGTNGIMGIPPYRFAGITLDSEATFFPLVWIALLVVTLAAYQLRDSRFGRGMIALRDDEIAVCMSGISAVALKIIAFALGATYAAVSGVAFAHHSNFISPGDFNYIHSIFYLSMLIVGGEGSVLGAIGGAMLVTFLPEWLRPLGQAYLSVFGALVLIILVFLPKGIVSLIPLSALGRASPTDALAHRTVRRGDPA